MKSNLEILRIIENKVTDLTQEERADVLDLLKFHAYEPKAAAERISKYLTEELPFGVGEDLIFNIITN